MAMTSKMALEQIEGLQSECKEGVRDIPGITELQGNHETLKNNLGLNSSANDAMFNASDNKIESSIQLLSDSIHQMIGNYNSYFQGAVSEWLSSLPEYNRLPLIEELSHSNKILDMVDSTVDYEQEGEESSFGTHTNGATRVRAVNTLGQIGGLLAVFATEALLSSGEKKPQTKELNIKQPRSIHRLEVLLKSANGKWSVIKVQRGVNFFFDQLKSQIESDYYKKLSRTKSELWNDAQAPVSKAKPKNSPNLVQNNISNNSIIRKQSRGLGKKILIGGSLLLISLITLAVVTTVVETRQEARNPTIYNLSNTKSGDSDEYSDEEAEVEELDESTSSNVDSQVDEEVTNSTLREQLIKLAKQVLAEDHPGAKVRIDDAGYQISRRGNGYYQLKSQYEANDGVSNYVVLINPTKGIVSEIKESKAE
ncbi:hypothetical protein EQG49_09085 [Periweissella cryptocerci]|uniref:Uncharacterized protein n=1 Tax=Periweissella cryptocerci TaxID=2506420 RepID=A0A4P6YV49_9LACO|nr:hypothetical protein [Periweissella cryptocerci]QBO36616.1 hypothetical protein EQG49_09085 [Periweissella cryptocerci]